MANNRSSLSCFHLKLVSEVTYNVVLLYWCQKKLLRSQTTFRTVFQVALHVGKKDPFPILEKMNPLFLGGKQCDIHCIIKRVINMYSTVVYSIANNNHINVACELYVAWLDAQETV